MQFYKSQYDEFISAWEREKRITALLFHIKTGVLVITFILMNDTPWHKTEGYRKFGIFLLMAFMVAIVLGRLFYIKSQWPAWFHDVERQIQKEASRKWSLLKTLSVLFTMLFASLLIGVFAVFLIQRFDEANALFLFQLVIIFFIAGALVKNHLDVKNGKYPNLFRGYMPEFLLLVVFSFVLPFATYYFLMDKSEANFTIFPLFSCSFIWSYALCWKNITASAYKKIADHIGINIS